MLSTLNSALQHLCQLLNSCPNMKHALTCSPHYLCLQHCPVPCSQQGLQHCLVIRSHQCLQHYSALHSQLCSQYYPLLINICPFWFNHAFHTQQCIPAITPACLSCPNQKHALGMLPTFVPQSTVLSALSSTDQLLPLLICHAVHTLCGLLQQCRKHSHLTLSAKSFLRWPFLRGVLADSWKWLCFSTNIKLTIPAPIDLSMLSTLNSALQHYLQPLNSCPKMKHAFTYSPHSVYSQQSLQHCPALSSQ